MNESITWAKLHCKSLDNKKIFKTALSFEAKLVDLGLKKL